MEWRRKTDTIKTAKILVDAASEQKALSLIIKDISWLWRTAHNCAVRGCSDWEGFQEQVASLFDICKDVRPFSASAL